MLLNYFIISFHYFSFFEQNWLNSSDQVIALPFTALPFIAFMVGFGLAFAVGALVSDEKSNFINFATKTIINTPNPRAIISIIITRAIISFG